MKRFSSHLSFGRVLGSELVRCGGQTVFELTGKAYSTYFLSLRNVQARQVASQILEGLV